MPRTAGRRPSRRCCEGRRPRQHLHCPRRRQKTSSSSPARTLLHGRPRPTLPRARALQLIGKLARPQAALPLAARQALRRTTGARGKSGVPLHRHPRRLRLLLSHQCVTHRPLRHRSQSSDLPQQGLSNGIMAPIMLLRSLLPLRQALRSWMTPLRHQWHLQHLRLYRLRQLWLGRRRRR
jgi:hypothetical protein